MKKHIKREISHRGMLFTGKIVKSPSGRRRNMLAEELGLELDDLHFLRVDGKNFGIFTQITNKHKIKQNEMAF